MIDKANVIPLARRIRRAWLQDHLHERNMRPHWQAAGFRLREVFKIREGRPHVLDRVRNGDINFIINTPSGKIPREDEVTIRNASLARKFRS